MSTLQLLVFGASILNMPPCSAEYFSLNDPSADTHWFNVWFNVRLNAHKWGCVWACERVCSRVGGWLRAFMFLSMLVGLHVRISAYVYFSAYVCVLMSGCLCACVRGSVYVFMCMHVFCPLTAYLYPCCDIYSSPSLCLKVQSGPRETCWKFNLLLGILSVQTCSVVHSEKNRLPISAISGSCSLLKMLPSCRLCVTLLGQHFSILRCIALGKDWTSWAIAAHPPSHAC